MKKEYFNPTTLFNSKQYGFSQIVVSKPGNMVFISGQVAWDENQQIIGEGDLAKQTEKSIENIKIALETIGGTLEDIVMLRIYKVNLQKEDGQIISQILRKKFGEEYLPASSWISVNGLANEHFLVEIEAQAVIYDLK